MINLGRLYFAHPMSMYGTPLERHIVEALAEQGYIVVNPSDQEHKDRVAEIKSSIADRDAAGKAIMEYFVDVCRSCDEVAFATFPNGTVGAGVAKEVDYFVSTQKPVARINWDYHQTTINLTQVGDLSNYLVLTVEQTRSMLAELDPRYAAQQAATPQL